MEFEYALDEYEYLLSSIAAGELHIGLTEVPVIVREHLYYLIGHKAKRDDPESSLLIQWGIREGDLNELFIDKRDPVGELVYRVVQSEIDKANINYDLEWRSP